MGATIKHKLGQIPLQSLMVFHEVAKRRSFSQAAKALSVSQPAVTKHIKNLEQKMGTSLIHRDKGNFILSDVGKILFKTTKKLSSHLVEVEKLLGELQEEHLGQLAIGTTESYSRCLFPDLLSSFEAAYPAIRITLNLGNSEEIERSLFTYKSDLALIGITKICPGAVSIPLLREKLVLIAHPSHPVIRDGAVSLKETVDYPFIVRSKGSTTRKILLQAFDSLGVHPSTLMEAGSSEFIKQWVMRGRAISIVAKSIVAEEEKRGLIKTCPILEGLHMDVAFIYLKEKESEPVIKLMRKFINHAKNWVAQNRFGQLSP